jgi:hypothetical protein
MKSLDLNVTYAENTVAEHESEKQLLSNLFIVFNLSLFQRNSTSKRLLQVLGKFKMSPSTISSIIGSQWHELGREVHVVRG